MVYNIHKILIFNKLAFFQLFFFLNYCENFPFFPVFPPLPPLTYICVFLNKSSYFIPNQPITFFFPQPTKNFFAPKLSLLPSCNSRVTNCSTIHGLSSPPTPSLNVFTFHFTLMTLRFRAQIAVYGYLHGLPKFYSFTIGKSNVLKQSSLAFIFDEINKNRLLFF